MKIIYSFLFDILKDIVDLMKKFEIYDNVSLFSFLIALTVISIVITYLVNVARSPGVRSISSERASRRRKVRSENNS